MNQEQEQKEKFNAVGTAQARTDTSQENPPDPDKSVKQCMRFCLLSLNGNVFCTHFMCPINNRDLTFVNAPYFAIFAYE